MADPQKTKKKSKKLTPRQRIFVERYLVNKNATKAALEAGYSKNTAAKIGSENLHKPEIKAAIDAEMAELTKRNALDADWVLQRLKAIADTHVEELVVVDEQNFRLKSDAEVDRMKLLAIDTFDDTELDMGKAYKRVRKVKLTDKVRALKLLGDYLGGDFIGQKDDSESSDGRDREDGLSQLPRLLELYKSKSRGRGRKADSETSV